MEIPTNDEGMFEAVDVDGDVVGHGIVSADDVLDFAYTDGTREARVVMPVDQFVTIWETMALHLGLTLRAAE